MVWRKINKLDGEGLGAPGDGEQTGVRMGMTEGMRMRIGWIKLD